ncbi:MAG: hypothetical protein RL077_1112 [Verrucomicrobiota bacterium]|jgi:hypothetical protein
MGRLGDFAMDRVGDEAELVRRGFIRAGPAGERKLVARSAFCGGGATREARLF